MKINRISELKSYIASKEAVSIDEICEKFQISKSTLRRDLSILSEEGCITKVYGGVRFKETKMLIPYEKRGVTNIESKLNVARCAAKLVEENDVIFIDSGTTTPHMVDYLGDYRLSIVTHSLSVLEKASGKPNIELYALPGLYYSGTYSFCGTDTVEALGRFNLTKAFMAASGISIANGATHSSSLENLIKRTAMAQAQSSYLLIDSSKFDTTAILTYADADSFDAILSEKTDDPAAQEFLKRLGIPAISD